jgi:hypothetical protein
LLAADDCTHADHDRLAQMYQLILSCTSQSVYSKYFEFLPVLCLQEEEDEVASTPKKTVFCVKLTGFDADKKIALIKEVKTLLPDTNLVQVREFHLFLFHSFLLFSVKQL